MPSTAEPVRKLAHFSDADKLIKECAAIENQLEALSHLYEQYFVGVERTAPLKKHEQLRARFDHLKSTFNRTTAYQFRVQNLGSRLLAFERLWQRTLQEMENGTYRRDLFKVRLRSKRRGSSRSESMAERKERPPNEVTAESPGQPANESPTESPKKAPPPAAAPTVVSSELSEAKLRTIYDAYLSAKKRCSEDVSQLSFEGMAAKLRKQVPHLMEKHKVRSVEFKIVIKDGKAILKAIPKD